MLKHGPIQGEIKQSKQCMWKFLKELREEEEETELRMTFLGNLNSKPVKKS
jgi:hypothetical protein